MQESTSFVVSARKYRPQRFEDVVGQEHVTQTLKNAIQLQRVAHAYLFTGPRGVGKTTTARILAKSINCLNSVNFEPCNECDSCVQILEGSLIDVVEMDAASNRGIDDVRAIIDSLRYPPNQAKYKIYIIDEVHMLTKDSFNALLKSLEEPPENTVFIFATTDVHKVPLTILSRCQRYDFRRISLETIRVQLRMIADDQGISIEDKTLMLIGRKADGALRDAESYFDQVVAFSGKTVVYEQVTQLLNVIDDELLFAVTNAVMEKNYEEAFRITNVLYSNGWNYEDFIDRLVEHIRNIMVVAATGNLELLEVADDFKPLYQKLNNVFSQSDLLRLVTFLSKVKTELKYSPNQRIKLEISLSQLIGFEGTLTISKLLQGVSVPEHRHTASPVHHTAAAPAHQTTAPAHQTTAPAQKPQVVITPPLPTTKQPAAVEVIQPAPVTVVQQEPEKPAPAPKAKKQAKENDDLSVLSFDLIKTNWVAFTQALISARRMTFSATIQYAQPSSFEQNTLYISYSDSETFDMILSGEKLIAEHFDKFFKRKISIKISLDKDVKVQTNNAHLTEKSANASPVVSDDPYTDFIQNQLGGERIN